MLSQPSLEKLPTELREAAAWIGERLEGAGFQAWIVGGAVRDLCLGRVPSDVDLTTDAKPEEIEALFESTTAVGKAFGTIVVHLPRRAGKTGELGMDVEVTTFRRDGAYLDGRHPEEVTYSSSVREDARRRDFTLNALYLGACTGEFQDPEHGFDDLAEGRLRCVGDARERFREDGLRLLRLVRFESRFDLTPTDETLAAARDCVDALKGVSPERVRAELEGLFATAQPGAGLRRMSELGLLRVALRPWAEMRVSGGAPEDRAALCASALEKPGGELSQELAFALLFEPDPIWSAPAEEWAALCDAALCALDALRPSRALRQSVEGCWRLRHSLRAALDKRAIDRSTRIYLLRDKHWDLCHRATLAWQAASENSLLDSRRRSALAELERERRRLRDEDFFPALFVEPKDLAALGIERGPRWGQLLREVERKQLDLELETRAEALVWLAEQAGH